MADRCICIDAAEECIGSAHVCCCAVNDYCRSDRHQCICDDGPKYYCRGTNHPCVCVTLQGRRGCLAEKDAHDCTCVFLDSPDKCRGAGAHACRCFQGDPDRCRGTGHHWCTCGSTKSPRKCKSESHECVCARTGGKCKSKKHACICSGHFEKCKAEAHGCSCHRVASARMRGYGCRGTAHYCVCMKALADTKACLGDGHVCVCAEGGAELCRRGGPARGHECTCASGRWQACRRWGAHDDPRVEARGVRALVVASHGSAPAAKTIISPVLSGFADLPYQLRLYVAEIAWTVAAAEAGRRGRENVHQSEEP